MANYVSSKRIEKFLIPDAGHIGVFTKKESLDNYWQKVLDFIASETGEPHSA